jgi:hypothetical protein
MFFVFSPFSSHHLHHRTAHTRKSAFVPLHFLARLSLRIRPACSHYWTHVHRHFTRHTHPWIYNGAPFVSTFTLFRPAIQTTLFPNLNPIIDYNTRPFNLFWRCGHGAASTTNCVWCSGSDRSAFFFFTLIVLFFAVFIVEPVATFRRIFAY